MSWPQQFSTNDAAVAHDRMLRRIRAAQLADEPEPDHEPWSQTLDASTYAGWEPPVRHWCCEWHKVHADGA